MLANLNGWHAAIIIAVILLLFGAPKIPMLARSLGQSMRIFKTEVREREAAPDVSATADPVGVATTDAAPAAVPVAAVPAGVPAPAVASSSTSSTAA